MIALWGSIQRWMHMGHMPLRAKLRVLVPNFLIDCYICWNKALHQNWSLVLVVETCRTICDLSGVV